MLRAVARAAPDGTILVRVHTFSGHAGACASLEALLSYSACRGTGYAQGVLMRKSPLVLTLSLILAACGSQPMTHSGDGTPGADHPNTPLSGLGVKAGSTRHVTTTPVGDVTPLFGEQARPAPYAHMVPLSPSEMRALLPSRRGDSLSAQAVSPAATATNRTVRVYYSDPLPTSSSYRDGGSFHAIMLRNLLASTATSRSSASRSRSTWRATPAAACGPSTSARSSTRAFPRAFSRM